jgi:hypothetical protein
MDKTLHFPSPSPMSLFLGPAKQKCSRFATDMSTLQAAFAGRTFFALKPPSF